MLQRNIRKYLFLRDWKWWKLYTKVKPLLNVARTEDELRQKEEELNKLREKVIKDENAKKELEESQTQLMEEKNQLYIQLQRVRTLHGGEMIFVTASQSVYVDFHTKTCLSVCAGIKFQWYELA